MPLQFVKVRTAYRLVFARTSSGLGRSWAISNSLSDLVFPKSLTLYWIRSLIVFRYFDLLLDSYGKLEAGNYKRHSWQS